MAHSCCLSSVYCVPGTVLRASQAPPPTSRRGGGLSSPLFPNEAEARRSLGCGPRPRSGAGLRSPCTGLVSRLLPAPCRSGRFWKRADVSGGQPRIAGCGDGGCLREPTELFLLRRGTQAGGSSSVGGGGRAPASAAPASAAAGGARPVASRARFVHAHSFPLLFA